MKKYLGFLIVMGLFSFVGLVQAEQVCTQEAKQCSDGSYVSRTGPKCEFVACPGEAPRNIIKPEKGGVVKEKEVTRDVREALMKKTMIVIPVTSVKREEAKAKMNATRKENKDKMEALKTEKEAFVLKESQDKFAKAVLGVEAGLAEATTKIAAAKIAAAAATDKESFEAARKLFMEAKQALEKAIRPMMNTQKMMSGDRAEEMMKPKPPMPKTDRAGTTQ